MYSLSLYDLDLNHVTLILDLDPDILKMYRTPKINFRKPEQYRQTDRQTDRRDRTHYHVAFAGGKIRHVTRFVYCTCLSR